MLKPNMETNTEKYYARSREMRVDSRHMHTFDHIQKEHKRNGALTENASLQRTHKSNRIASN